MKSGTSRRSRRKAKKYSDGGLLFPSYAPTGTWRPMKTHVEPDAEGSMRFIVKKKDLRDSSWRRLRNLILERDNFTCRHCCWKAFKWQVVHHIDGDHRNDDPKNLGTVCPMCNLILHAGFGCVISGVVDLYKRSKLSQPEIIQRTRKLRALGKPDRVIIKNLGLVEKVPFRKDSDYLRPLFGFITSRTPAREDRLRQGLSYVYEETRKQMAQSAGKK